MKSIDTSNNIYHVDYISSPKKIGRIFGSGPFFHDTKVIVPKDYLANDLAIYKYLSTQPNITGKPRSSITTIKGEPYVEVDGGYRAKSIRRRNKTNRRKTRRRKTRRNKH